MDISSIEYKKSTVDIIFFDKKYQIPKYQRPFAWNKEKAEKFWNDIVCEEGDYFMGTIVLNKHNSIHEIVDGQQRITTISLFFFALYLNYKDSVDEATAKMHIYKYLKTSTIKSESQLLTLSKNNFSFYNNLLEIKTKDDLANIVADNKSNKNILEIVNYFIGKINENKKTDPNLEKIRLADMLEKFTKKVFFFEITVTDYKQASKLFEVLNNRGVNLVKSDLVRNYLLSEAERQKFQEEEINWDGIEDNISGVNLEKFIRYSSILLSKKDDLYERVIEYTENHSSKTSIDLLSDLSKIYKKIIDPSFSDDDFENKLLTELDILGVTQAHSILLAGYNKFNNEDIRELLQLIVNFSFRYSTICGKNPNKLEKKYSDLAYEVFNNSLSLDEVKKQIIELSPSDDEFMKSFVSKNFKNTIFPRYILGKIENFISSEEKIIDFPAVHLEHIMPKKIDKWIEEDGEVGKYYDKYVNNIGNMVLLSKSINTAIKNNIFSIKREKYDGSEINLVGDIKAKKKWNEEEIKWNGNRYYEHAKNIWKI